MAETIDNILHLCLFNSLELAFELRGMFPPSLVPYRTNERQATPLTITVFDREHTFTIFAWLT